jgi:hypothetical protein
VLSDGCLGPAQGIGMETWPGPKDALRGTGRLGMARSAEETGPSGQPAHLREQSMTL